MSSKNKNLGFTPLNPESLLFRAGGKRRGSSKENKYLGFQSGDLTGFTLIELVVVIGIFITAGIFIVAGFDQAVQALASSRSKVTATALANEKLEILRNMPYDSLGTITGWPQGDVPASETTIKNNFEFIVETRIDYVDDPFDGNADGSIENKPVDTAPNDYKKVEVSVRWNKPFVQPVLLSTIVSPSGLESAENTGSLLIQVFNASGVSVPQATVEIINNQVIPAINIINTTDNDGNLQVLSLPPAIESYHIEVTKQGYSSDSTYAPDPDTLPNPVKPDVTIITESVTEVSFAIDLLSGLTISTITEVCEPVPNVPLSIWGEKLIGTDPDVLKFSSEPPTNEAGTLVLNELEWDNYTLIETSSDYDVAGVIPPALLNILPNTNQSTALVLAPHTTHSLRVTVKDGATETALTGASVRLSKTGFEETKLTGYGFFEQNDWSGGAGQDNFSDPTKYLSDDGNIDSLSTPGNLTLKSQQTNQNFFEDFTTNTYKDELATTANWNTSAGQVELQEQGGSYITAGIAQTINVNARAGKITKATLTVTEVLNGQTINYFLSADGGTNFEAVTPGVEHIFISSGDDLRMRVVLETTNPAVTPLLDNSTLTYTIVSYATSGVLTSSTFNTGGQSNFGALTWLPTTQPAEAGPESVKVQIATNNDNQTWNFIGPDGTADTYYTNSGTDLHASHDNNQYIRYKIFLSTADPGTSPILSSIKIGYTSACVPPGQVFFSNLTSDTYSLDITLEGYQALNTSVTVNGTTQAEYFLTPL